MADETFGTEQTITVVKDDEGILFLGNSSQIKQWLDDSGITSREFTARALAKAGDAGQVMGTIASESGRWVKLTEESTKLLKQYAKSGPIQKGVAQNKAGKVVKWLEFETPKDLLNPAMATGVAGMMTQMALEQAIEEITEYLKTIDAKVDELLQDQKDQVVANLMGASLEVDEAIAIRDAAGMLNDSAWSKVAPCAKTTSSAQGYSLLKLKGLADKLDAAGDMDALSKAAESANKDTADWLTVLALSVQTRDKLSVVELESVYRETPEVLEEHRQGIVEARKHRLQAIQQGVAAYRASLTTAADRARAEKLMHPFAVDKTIELLNRALQETDDFAERLDFEIEERSIERAKRWKEIAAETINDAASDAAETGRHLAKRGQELGQSAAEGAGELADTVGEKAEEIGAAVAKGAEELGRKLKEVDVKQLAENLPKPLFFRRRW